MQPHAIHPLTVDRRLWQAGALVLLASLLAVIAIDLVTNELNTTRYFWDFALYYDMAEHGLGGSTMLYAPFAYRFATPLLAGALADGLHLSVPEGFKIIAYAGAVAQLALVFALARYFRAGRRDAALTAASVALSLYNLKFLIFDVSRPDHLAYPLMVVAMLALFERRWAICLITSCAGLLVREFLIIPPLLMLVLLTQDYRRTRSTHTLRWIVLVIAAVGLAVGLPRALIPIRGSGQYVDPLNDSGTLRNLVRAPLSERRSFNILFNLASYTLPLWLLLTPRRLRIVWDGLAGVRALLGLYVALVLVLTMYGGTDLWRFVTYLFVPQAIALAVLLRDGDVDGAEILFMLAAAAFYNKILLDIPNYYEPYLDFYGGYDNRVNVFTALRLYQLAALALGMLLLRGLLALARRGWDLRRAPG